MYAAVTESKGVAAAGATPLSGSQGTTPAATAATIEIILLITLQGYARGRLDDGA